MYIRISYMYIHIHNQFTHTHLYAKDLGLCKVLQEKLKFFNFFDLLNLWSLEQSMKL